ncbi:MAG TPA: serine hydrolase [Bacteroidales bacterium]|nr:serine hydrolase [Bacteroidales bacterium]
MRKIKGIFVLFSLVLLSSGCKKERINEYKYHIPEASVDGWEVDSSDNVGISSLTLSQMMDHINGRSGHNIHNILIFKNGKLVFEEYFEGYLYVWDPPGSNGDFIQYDRETDHFLASVSKSITSVLFGVAMKEGFINTVDDKVIDIFPEYKEILTDAKADITIKQLLTMSSGLAWDESSTSYEDPANDVRAMFDSDDPLDYVLSRPLLYPPGTQFLYNSGGTNVLGAVIQKYSGKSLLDFGNEYLFNPLNVEGGAWQRLSPDYYFASGGIFLRPRELAKIGYLFLNNGYWGDKQIITPDWIAESVEKHIATQGRTLTLAHGYGYQWWLEDFQVNGHTYNSFLAAGWGDQYMFIFPAEDLMIVFNGGNYLKGGSISPFSLVGNYILISIQ